MPPVQIYALGRLRVLYNETTLQFASKKALDLFCFLLLHAGETVERDLAAEQLWPMRPQGKARRSLATSLWRLRQTLKTVDSLEDILVVSDRNTVAFNLDVPYWFDVHAFEQNAAFGLQGTLPLEPSCLQALKKAVDLYRGDLFQDCYDDWCLVERERLQLLFLQVLKRLQRNYRLRGEFEAAVACGRRLLALDPLQEEVHRELMRCHMAEGQRPLALAQFEECRRTLSEELSIEPMPETWRLYREIRNGLQTTSVQQMQGDELSSLQATLSRFRRALDTLESAWQSLQTLAIDLVQGREDIPSSSVQAGQD